MKLLLDTANLGDIKRIREHFPIVGVTTNPTILAKEGGDLKALLLAIREILGSELELHVQVTSTDYEEILKEARAAVALLGENTFVKIPMSENGLHAIATLAKEGVSITATAVLTPGQALLAANAGAKYVAPYVSRYENIGGDGVQMVAEIHELLLDSETEILAAIFKTMRSILDVALTGAESATIGTELMDKLLAHPVSASSIEGFAKDWDKAFGGKKLYELF